MEFQPMSPDEIQRMMNFLLQEQAKFDAVIDMFERHLREDHGHRPS